MPQGRWQAPGVAPSAAAAASALGLYHPGEFGWFVLSSKKGKKQP